MYFFSLTGAEENLSKMASAHNRSLIDKNETLIGGPHEEAVAITHYIEVTRTASDNKSDLRPT